MSAHDLLPADPGRGLTRRDLACEEYLRIGDGYGFSMHTTARRRPPGRGAERRPREARRGLGRNAAQAVLHGGFVSLSATGTSG